MDFTSSLNDKVLTLSLDGDLIGEEIGQSLMSEINDHIHKGIRHCIIDISKVRYVNSSGIGLLITVLTKFRNKGGDLILIQPSSHVQKLLIITKLNAIFTICDTMDEALNKLKG